MAERLVSPYPLVWSTGLARAGVGCQGAVSDQVLAGRRGWARLESPVDGGDRVRNPRRPSLQYAGSWEPVTASAP